MFNKFNLQLQGKEKNVFQLFTVLFNFKTKLFLILSEVQEEGDLKFSKDTNFL